MSAKEPSETRERIMNATMKSAKLVNRSGSAVMSNRVREGSLVGKARGAGDISGTPLISLD